MCVVLLRGQSNFKLERSDSYKCSIICIKCFESPLRTLSAYLHTIFMRFNFIFATFFDMFAMTLMNRQSLGALLLRHCANGLIVQIYRSLASLMSLTAQMSVYALMREYIGQRRLHRPIHKLKGVTVEYPSISTDTISIPAFSVLAPLMNYPVALMSSLTRTSMLLQMLVPPLLWQILALLDRSIDMLYIGVRLIGRLIIFTSWSVSSFMREIVYIWHICDGFLL